MNNWISILEEEPNAGQGVLVVFNTGVIAIAYRVLKKNSHNWQVYGPLGSLGLTNADYVTHWMHLPHPPEFIDTPIHRELYQYPSHFRNKK